MRILFTADHHLKLGQKNVPTEWAKARYRSFFAQVYEIEKSVDLHIIGGDLFDRLPTLEELELYFEFLEGISVPTIIFDGNHEATKKYRTFFTSLKAVTERINDKVSICDTSTVYDTFSILPYCDLHRKGSIEAMPDDKMLFTHVRGEIPPHVTPEVDLSRFEDFPLVFAGDLHAHSNSQLNIIYPGSPMTTSFHRSIVETGYIIIEHTMLEGTAEKCEWEWKPFQLPQLLRKTVSNPDEMEPSDYHHTIYELEGDIQDLAKVANSELLDKKVVKRSSEATLLLDKEMTLGEELNEYLRYILELPDDKITSILGAFNDYSSKIKME